MRTIGARFAGTRLIYRYLVPEGDDPKVGDILVTSVNWNITDEPDEDVEFDSLIATAKMATVVSVDETIDPKATKFYVALLSLEQLKRRMIENYRVAERVKAQQKIQAKLDAILAREDKRIRYARLAETNAEARALLAELDGPMIEGISDAG